MEYSNFYEQSEAFKEFHEMLQGDTLKLTPEQTDYLQELEPLMQGNELTEVEKSSLLKDRLSEIFETSKEKIQEFFSDKNTHRKAAVLLAHLLKIKR